MVILVKMTKQIEIFEAASGTLVEPLVGRRYKARLIEGDRLGSTGYYPAETLLRDGPKVFKKGTPMYLNHQTVAERENRPHGSIQEYAGELAEDAYYDGDGLYAEIEVFEHQMPLIKSLKDRIGISIRARGVVVDENMNGVMVPVFKQLLMARSADFVVKAGAGGKLMSILESALEDSETASEETKESEEAMEKEILEAIESLRTDFSARLTNLEEAAKPVVEPVVVKEAVEAAPEAVVDYAKVLEIAEALSNSTLDAEGKARVLELHAGGKKSIGDLIEAEEAYIKKNVIVKTSSEDGFEEREAEESAGVTKIALPSAWKKKVK